MLEGQSTALQLVVSDGCRLDPELEAQAADIGGRRHFREQSLQL